MPISRNRVPSTSLSRSARPASKMRSARRVGLRSLRLRVRSRKSDVFSFRTIVVAARFRRLQPPRHLLAQLAQRREKLVAPGEIAVEGRLGGDALGLAARVDGARVDAARQPVEPLAHLAESTHQVGLVETLELADRPQPLALERAFRRLADAPDQRDGLARRGRPSFPLSPMMEKPRGFSRSLAILARNLLWDRPIETVTPISVSIVRASACESARRRLAVELLGAGKVEEGLVDRQRLHQGRDREHQGAHRAADRRVFRHVRLQHHGLRTELQGLEHRHGRPHALDARDVAGGGDDAADAAADDQRPVAQLGAVPFLDRGVEGIAVDMGDRPAGPAPGAAAGADCRRQGSAAPRRGGGQAVAAETRGIGMDHRRPAATFRASLAGSVAGIQDCCRAPGSAGQAESRMALDDRLGLPPVGRSPGPARQRRQMRAEYLVRHQVDEVDLLGALRRTDSRLGGRSSTKTTGPCQRSVSSATTAPLERSVAIIGQRRPSRSRSARRLS